MVLVIELVVNENYFVYEHDEYRLMTYIGFKGNYYYFANGEDMNWDYAQDDGSLRNIYFISEESSIVQQLIKNKSLEIVELSKQLNTDKNG